MVHGLEKFKEYFSEHTHQDEVPIDGSKNIFQSIRITWYDKAVSHVLTQLPY